MTQTELTPTTPLTGKWKPYPAYKDSGVEWLGEIPEYWKASQLKYIVRLRYGDSLPSEARLEGDIPVFGSNGPVGFHCRSNTLAPVLVIGRKGSFGKINFSNNPCFAIDTTYYIDERNSRADLRWLFYAMQLLRLDAISQDSAIPGLSRELTEEQWLPIMPLPEQRAIATFLDRETARINTLITKKERLIELLQEKRAALISHAVTKGLDPTVPMKDSGVEWLGEIPEHWEVKRLKHVASILRGKFSHRPRNDPRLYDGSYPFIQTGDITSTTKYITDYHQTLNELGFAVSKQFPSNTLVMSIAANIGDLAILQIPACFPDSIVGFVPAPQVALNYLYYNLTAMKQEMVGTATINTQLNLNVERIGCLYTTFPLIGEQYAIATYLDNETTKIDALVSKIREGMEKLKEYSTTLISAAVTGKIDVRETISS